MASGHRRVPHPKAEHMAAPTSDSALGQQSSCQHGAVHTWPKADIPCRGAEISHRCRKGELRLDYQRWFHRAV